MEILARINALHNELARAHFEGADFAAVRLCIVASALHARLGIERAIRRWAWQYRAIWLAIGSERLLLAIVDAEERGRRGRRSRIPCRQICIRLRAVQSKKIQTNVERRDC